MSKNTVETQGPQMTLQYGAYALRAGFARVYARMRTHARTSMHTHANMRYFLLLHSNNDFVNAPQCYVLHTLPVLLNIMSWRYMGHLWPLRPVLESDRYRALSALVPSKESPIPTGWGAWRDSEPDGRGEKGNLPSMPRIIILPLRFLVANFANPTHVGARGDNDRKEN
jgi:hypothetical protein